MKTKSLFLFLCIFFAAYVAFAQTQPQIHVSADASEEVVPDIIKVSVYLSEADSKGKYSINELNASFEKVLNSLGVDIQTDVFVVDQSSKNVRRTSVYNYKNYQVIMHSASDVDRLFVLLQENQINNAYISSFEYSKKEELEEKLRVEAILKAKKMAESLAAAISQSIGSAIDISSNTYVSNGGLVRTMSMSKSLATDAMEMPMQDVQVKKILIKQSVSASFILNPKKSDL